MKTLKTIRKRNSSEEGFSLVTASGFGLVIMMIGLTIMSRAIKDSSISASQKVITRSDAAAQTGTTRVLALISEYPQLAGIKDCVGIRSELDNSCPDDANAISWANPGKIPTLPASAYDTSSDLLNQIKSGAWQNIDTANTNKGQFRLASYTPPTSGTGLGNVDINGRVGQAANGKNDVQTASAQAEADIAYTPEREGVLEKISGAVFPGIWLSHPQPVSQIFVANGLLEDLTGNDAGSKKLFAHMTPNIAASKVVDGPSDVSTTALRIASFRPAKPSSYNATLPDSDVTLPRSGDLPKRTSTINGVTTEIYEYYFPGTITQDVIVNTVNSSGSGTGNAKKVLIYLDGDIDPQGNKAITHTCKDRSGGSVASGSCDLSNFQIYGYKPYNATAIPKICLHGKHRVEAFIIAPDYTAGLKGGGDGKGGIHGALWARSWGEGGSSCNSSSQHPGVQQTGTAWNELAAYFPTTPTITAAVQATAAQVGRKLPTASSTPTTEQAISAANTSADQAVEAANQATVNATQAAANASVDEIAAAAAAAAAAAQAAANAANAAAAQAAADAAAAQAAANAAAAQAAANAAADAAAQAAVANVASAEANCVQAGNSSNCKINK